LYLQNAAASLTAASTQDQAGKLKTVRYLSKRLLQARVHALGAKISRLKEPNSKRSVPNKAVMRIERKKAEILAKGVEGISKEFGVNCNTLPVAKPKRIL
jgi:primosomal protein N''